MNKRLKVVLLLFVIILISILIFIIRKKEKKEYQILEDYSMLAILVDGVPSTTVPTDKFYFMSYNCNGMDLDWNVLEKN